MSGPCSVRCHALSERIARGGNNGTPREYTDGEKEFWRNFAECIIRDVITEYKAVNFVQRDYSPFTTPLDDPRIQQDIKDVEKIWDIIVRDKI